MDQRDKMLEVARAQVGYREGDNNATKYGAWYGLDRQPWCAMFVAWCAAQAGVLEGTIPKMAYVPDMVAFYRLLGRYRSRDAYQPKVGDLIFFGSSSHVGIVDDVATDEVITIEGNTSASGNSSNGDGVYRRRRKRTDSWIMGYAIPDYGDRLILQRTRVERRQGAKQTSLSLSVANINGANYVYLRDLAALVPGAEVGYDAALKAPVITLPTPEATTDAPDKQSVRDALSLLAKACGV